MAKKKIFDYKQVEDLAAQGLMDKEIFYNLGISHDTFYKSIKKNAAFSEAVKRGRARGINQVSNALFQKALTGDNACMIFFLKARADWRDNYVVIEQDADRDQLKKIDKSVTAIDASKAYQKMMK